MPSQKHRTIRNPSAYEKSQRAKQRRHQSHVAAIAKRLVAIIRDKHDGTMEASGLPQAWVLLAQGGALKPGEGRQGDVSRQALVQQALQQGVASGQIHQEVDKAGLVTLSVPRPSIVHSPEVLRMMAIERYEEALPRVPGRLYVDLRRWGEAV